MFQRCGSIQSNYGREIPYLSRERSDFGSFYYDYGIYYLYFGSFFIKYSSFF